MPSSVRDVTQRGVGVSGKTKRVANRAVLFVVDGFWEWKSKGWPQVFSCNLLMGFGSGSLRGVLKCFIATRWFTACFFKVPLHRCCGPYIFVCFMSASNLHVYSEVGPAIEVIRGHGKADAMEPMEFMECFV